MITDQNGNEKLPATLQNVKHVRLAKFNLFSLTKGQKAGWLLNGDSEKIWKTKGEHKIVFNIQIKTPEAKSLLYTTNRKKLKSMLLEQNKQQKSYQSKRHMNCWDT
jgi:hypothetical protein